MMIAVSIRCTKTNVLFKFYYHFVFTFRKSTSAFGTRLYSTLCSTARRFTVATFLTTLCTVKADKILFIVVISAVSEM